MRTIHYDKIPLTDVERQRLACLHAAQFVGFRRYRVLAYFMRGVPSVAPEQTLEYCWRKVPLFELAIIFDFEGYPMRAIYDRYNLKRETVH